MLNNIAVLVWIPLIAKPLFKSCYSLYFWLALSLFSIRVNKANLKNYALLHISRHLNKIYNLNLNNT